MHKHILLLLCLLLGWSSLSAQRTTAANTESRVEALLAKMTIDEKMGQLNQPAADITTGTDVSKDDLLNAIRAGQVGSVLSHLSFENKIKIQQVAVKESRLGIPIVFGFDVIHGYKTIFPIPLAQAASWDMSLIEQIERIAATEAAADGQNWTFTPMVDIARDPRWGRVMEGAGEDPYLGSRVAAARVKGIQGTDLSSPSTLAACVKHFAAYGFAEAGRDYNTVDMSEQRLREIVLPPFESAAKAGAASFMNSFNTINGVPASMNKHLITDILRGEWGWKGLVVSDWNSFGETIVHGAAEDEVDASAKCLGAGSDMDMAGNTFLRGLKKAWESGRVTTAQIDEAVRRVLRLKFALGLMDDPFRYLDARRRETQIEKPEYRQVAREAAARSMVLLKNDRNLLPLTPGGAIKKIALIGSFVDNKSNKDYMSFWTGAIGQRSYDSTKIVTPAAGLKPALESMGFIVTVVPICPNIVCTAEDDMIKAVNAARDNDLVIVFMGETGWDMGESRSVSEPILPRSQENIIRIAGRVNKNTIAVIFNGRPLVMPLTQENAAGILIAWQPGYETGNALADILTGKVNPSGKLPMTFPRNAGQIPIYYNALNTGRPQSYYRQLWTSGYLDVPATPLYPFGYGLSYTSFSYSTVTVTKPVMRMDETQTVSVTVTNTGKVMGEEVVQCYIRDLSADIARPLKELKGFEKIRLAPGASKVVTFNLTKEDLAYWNADVKRKADPGKFKVFVGGNSVDVKEADFELK